VATPDGHRAPIADQLLRVRSVDTQTPCDGGGANGTAQALIGRRWRPHDDVITGSSPPAVTSSALPVVPPFNDDNSEDDDDDYSDDDVASTGDSQYWIVATVKHHKIFVCFILTTVGILRVITINNGRKVLNFLRKSSSPFLSSRLLNIKTHRKNFHVSHISLFKCYLCCMMAK